MHVRFVHILLLLGFDATVMILLISFLKTIYGHCGTINYYRLLYGQIVTRYCNKYPKFHHYVYVHLVS
jgi:hypothetical protein